MKTNTILLFILLASSNYMFSQVAKDTLGVDYIYEQNYYNGSFSPEEIWKIYKAAYIKQLESKGLTNYEFNKSILNFSKQKETFITRINNELKLTEVQLRNTKEQIALTIIEIKKADKQRAKDTSQRVKDARHLVKDAIQRTKVNQWRKNTDNILIKNIKLSNQLNNNKPIFFKVTAKTTLKIGVRAHINSGITLIEIYNPKGIKEGELSLKFKSKPVSNEEKEGLEYNSGALDKTITGAEIGEWKIKITSKKAEGFVAISVVKYLKPTMNE
jgi:hypothetical protein